MFCKIRNRECSSAGEIVLEQKEKLGDKMEEFKSTICYREGGRTNCI